MLQGRLPISLINPTILHNVLRNVSLHLPPNYELVAGTKLQDMDLYYDLVKIAMIGNSRNIKMIMRVPLKSADQQFSIYKLIVLPTRISMEKCFRYKLHFSYFGLAFSQREYILLKAEDLQRCTTGSIVICPANIALFDSQLLTCAASSMEVSDCFGWTLHPILQTKSEWNRIATTC